MEGGPKRDDESLKGKENFLDPATKAEYLDFYTSEQDLTWNPLKKVAQKIATKYPSHIQVTDDDLPASPEDIKKFAD